MNKLHSMTSVAALLALSVTGTAVHAENQPAPNSNIQGSKTQVKKTTAPKKAADASCGNHKAGDGSCGSN
ncbi:hypothetical protein [Acinetobacter sp. MB5]|uniref:hypothetical protein n=1 Tax=Acinetobacter sp. MB5 TaxID=2069438 RepID=UPI000DD0D6B4